MKAGGTMKNMIRSIKLYFKISFFLPTIIISLVLFAVTLDFLISYRSPSENEHMLFLLPYSFGHISVVAFFMAGLEKTKSCKFFSSTSDARRFATVVPAVSAALLSMAFDIVMCIVLTMFDLSMGADSLIINAVTGIFMCFIASALDKPMLYPLCCGGMIAYTILSKKFIDLYFEGWTFRYGFGLTLPAALLAALAVYAAGTAVNTLILDIWWKKFGRSFSNNNSGEGDSAAMRRVFSFMDK